MNRITVNLRVQEDGQADRNFGFDTSYDSYLKASATGLRAIAEDIARKITDALGPYTYPYGRSMVTSTADTSSLMEPYKIRASTPSDTMYEAMYSDLYKKSIYSDWATIAKAAEEELLDGVTYDE